MAFTVPPLPFAMDALEPYMSSKTLSYHYGKHNKAYNDTLNNLIKGTDYETMPLEESFAQRRAVRFLTTPLSALTTLSFGTA